ncbi:DUF6048 family protein [Xanthocytophaga agilis]|uniref:DUF6048 family protein n=1 Tax=Xanthocytophaga agilis TaxID=3048010 RepID=A0AAE3RB27_9BACT|nr:DUF6048 family protein [Xanthocytophaga agilis]MDJ1504097.1 DUF6048 family protein [Xanthocytophaga agilis]
MKLYNPILISFLTIVLSSYLTALYTPAYSQKSASDTILSNGLRIGFDLGRIANFYMKDQKNFSLEGSADIGYQRWLGVAELGYANIKSSKDQVYDYNSNGVYGRVGVERNLLKGGDDVVFWGLRYGISQMTYSYGYYNVIDTIWGGSSGSIPKTSATQHWGELVGGIKGLVWKNFYLGFTLRFRFKISGSYNADLGPIIVPGYGAADKSTAFGANYYVSYRIPFKKPATFPKKKKVKKDKKAAPVLPATPPKK